MSKSFKILQNKMSKKQKQMSKKLFDELIESTNQAIKHAEDRNQADITQPLSKEDEETLTKAWQTLAKEVFDDESLVPDLIDERGINVETKVDHIIEQVIQNLNRDKYTDNE